MSSNYADTSGEAYRRAKKRGTQDAREVYEFVLRSGRNFTCDELEVAMGRTHQTMSARIMELVGAKLFSRTGAKRRTRSGSRANVIEANAYPEVEVARLLVVAVKRLYEEKKRSKASPIRLYAYDERSGTREFAGIRDCNPASFTASAIKKRLAEGDQPLDLMLLWVAVNLRDPDEPPILITP